MNIHRTAERMAAQQQITKSEALSRLAKRRRNTNYGRTTVDRRAFATVEKPKRYWWND